MIPSTRAPRPIVLSWSHDLVPLFLRVQLARAPLPSLLTWHSSVLPLHPAGGSLRFARRAVRTAPSHLLARWATRPLVAEQHTATFASSVWPSTVAMAACCTALTSQLAALTSQFCGWNGRVACSGDEPPPFSPAEEMVSLKCWACCPV